VTEDTWRRHNGWGSIRLLADTAIRVATEHLSELRRDIRYGLRALAASPGFTAVALISLTLGIGVATSAFSWLNGYFLRDVPAVTRPDDLVVAQAPVSYDSYKRYRERRELFSDAMAYEAPVPFGVSFGGRTERTWGHLVTASYFATLGVTPAVGRSFVPEDEQPGRAPIVVVSHRFWVNHLGSDPAVIGKALQVNRQPCTIIGVGPEEFQGASPMLSGADLWLPVSVGAHVAPELAGDPLARYDLAILHFVARLRPGVAASGAEAALDAVARQLEQEHGDPERNRKGRRVTLLPGGKLFPIPKRELPLLTGFMALLGGMILLIASSNVASMVLARGADRRQEIAIRTALGAGRARLIRQLLTENMLVAAGAGVLGLLLRFA
jgi:predicted permease